MENPAALVVRVLLASVLKPVDDTRMFEKFGRSLQQAGYAVHVAGRASSTAAAAGPIRQHVLFRGHRLAFSRLSAQWRYWQLLRELRPQVVIVHAPELLPLTLLWHWLRPQRAFLYDVRENYALNIRSQQVYRGALRQLLAGAVRWVEKLAYGRAAAVLLAERSYAQELPDLPAARTVVLENKYAPPPGEILPGVPPAPLPTPAEPLGLLYSGTISELNGVFDAIELARQLRPAWPGLQLTIIGYCQQPAELRRLEALAAEHAAWLRLVGGAQPVPHAAIVTEIGRHHLGLLPYRAHPSFWRCLPTKLYEYLACGLPVLLPPNPLWQREVQQHDAGLTVDFTQPLPDPAALAAQLSGRHFYPRGPAAAARWISEAPRLLAAVAAAAAFPRR
ncbi:glycosyltransferase [Hymenobacter sp. B81]|uniref:glycosyltransferase n=1 Tax=Hymenobacter sp. B81 TaxID=3344878 RepID=UPI0037DC2FA9